MEGFRAKAANLLAQHGENNSPPPIFDELQELRWLWHKVIYLGWIIGGFFFFMATAFCGGCEVATVGISHCETIGKDAGLTFVHFQARLNPPNPDKHTCACRGFIKNSKPH